MITIRTTYLNTGAAVLNINGSKVLWVPTVQTAADYRVLLCRAGRYMPRGATYKDLKQAKLTLKSTRFYMPNKYLD